MHTRRVDVRPEVPVGAEMTLVSLRELAILAVRVLRHVGLTPGAVQDAARIIVDLEIGSARGLDALKALLDCPAAERGLDPAAPEITAELGGGMVVSGGGASSLLLAPACLDLACLLAREHGAGAVLAEAAVATHLAEGILEHSSRRGFDAIVTWASTPTQARWSRRFGAEIQSGAGRIGVPEHGGRSEAARIVGEGGTRLLTQLRACRGPLVDLALGEGPSSGAFLLVCASREARSVLGRSVAERGFWWIGGAGEPVSSAAEARALTAGLRVEAGTWALLSDAASQTLAPESERSMRDAGPGVGEAQR